MRYSKAIFTMAISLLFVGCAVQSERGDEEVVMTRGVAKMVEEQGTLEIPTAGSLAAVDSEVVCQRYSKTGSHMKHTYCWTVAEARDVQDQVRRKLNIFGPNTRIEAVERASDGPFSAR